MEIEQIYTSCLSQATYYIVSEGEAAIIDPLRDITPYINRIEKDNVKLKYIFETHLHADFVSGHLSLAKKTNATIIYGATTQTNFDAIIAKDGQEFPLGKITVKAIHTPGHTMESTSYLLKNENGREIAIFTGDTLFLGDVGRPDLAQNTTGMTTEDLAGILYDSLRHKIMTLPNEITIYPGHGAGSACGKNMSKETVDTLGNQKKTNYALRADMNKEEFIKEVTTGISNPPEYFPLNVQLNAKGYTDIDEVIEKSMIPLSVEDFEKEIKNHNAIVLDIRDVSDFTKSHIPKSIFVGLKGQFAPWAGTIIKNVEQPLVLIAEEGLEREAIIRLSRVGFDHILGYLKGGIDAWEKSGRETDSVISINAQEFEKQYSEKNITVIDVRKESEYNLQHIEKSKNIPLSQLENSLNELPKNEKFYIHCAGGYRSMIAASILKRKGIHNLIDVTGGFNKIKETSIYLSNKTCLK